MQIEVKLITGASRNLLKQDVDNWKLYITAQPIDGKANRAIIDYLAREFKVPKSAIEIIKGLKSKHKTINIQTSVSS